MFDDTLNSSWDERSRRGLTTLTSFGLQMLAVGGLLVLPLLRPAGLPLFRQLSTPVSMGQPLAEAPAVRAHAGANTAAPVTPPAIFLTPSPRFRPGLPVASEDPGQVEGSGPFIPGGIKGDPRGLPNWFESGTGPVLPAPPPVAPVRRSHMSEGDLVRKILPTYPPLARAARIQGQVLLQAVISKEGTIENLRVLAGHPMLVPAAIEAVRKWRYRPYILNNEPVEVETQITVNFSLSGN
jgi:periplasmic protein TonB